MRPNCLMLSDDDQEKLAAAIKGIGVAGLRKHGLVKVFKKAVKGRKKESKQGSLFAFECLSLRLEQLFEPFIVMSGDPPSLLDVLLEALGDGDRDIQSAAQAAAKAWVSKLTPHGIKLVMPILLKGFNGDKWRSRQAAMRMLGQTAYLSPTQLAACLPQVMAEVVHALSDPHLKVCSFCLS